MNFNDKIDEWIKEAETRPASALMILKLVANRLRDLTGRNEELLAENLALQDGTRVQDYQKRIVHLERQLEMLKRQVGDGSSLAALPVETESPNLLVYNAQGQIFRFAVQGNPATLGRISGELVSGGEFPRLLAAPAHEELLFLFTSGRVSTLRVDEIPLAEGDSFSWEPSCRSRACPWPTFSSRPAGAASSKRLSPPWRSPSLTIITSAGAAPRKPTSPSMPCSARRANATPSSPTKAVCSASMWMT
jgi:hypothetical protein